MKLNLGKKIKGKVNKGVACTAAYLQTQNSNTWAPPSQNAEITKVAFHPVEDIPKVKSRIENKSSKKKSAKKG